MKINNSIEIKIKMHTESQNHTSTQEKMREHTFILKNQKEEQAFEDMIEKHFLEEDMLNSLIEEYLLKQDIQDSIIEEQALEAERFNSLVEERIQEYADLYDAIEGFEEDDCDYGPDYDDYPYENEIGVDLALYSPQFEYDESEDSSCCFEIGYYNDENSSGIFGGYVDMYHPEFVPSFRHINNF